MILRRRLLRLVGLVVTALHGDAVPYPFLAVEGGGDGVGEVMGGVIVLSDGCDD